jgi:hypothetical protein
MEEEIWWPTGKTIIRSAGGLRRFFGFVDPRRADRLAVTSGAPFITGVVPVT